MSLRNLLEMDLISCSPKESIKHVAEIMKKNGIGAVVVTENQKPIGIVTDRDIALRCVAEGLSCENTTVGKIMTLGVETVSIDEGIFDVIQVMKENEIRRVPVVDEEGFAVGLLSFGDVYQLIGQELNDLLAPTAPEQPKIVDQAA